MDGNALVTVFDGNCVTRAAHHRVTLSTALITLDKDTEKSNTEEPNGSLSVTALPPQPGLPAPSADRAFGEHLPELPQPKPELWQGKSAEAMRARWRWLLTVNSKRAVSATPPRPMRGWYG